MKKAERKGPLNSKGPLLQSKEMLCDITVRKKDEFVLRRRKPRVTKLESGSPTRSSFSVRVLRDAIYSDTLIRLAEKFSYTSTIAAFATSPVENGGICV